MNQRTQDGVRHYRKTSLKHGHEHPSIRQRSETTQLQQGEVLFALNLFTAKTCHSYNRTGTGARTSRETRNEYYCWKQPRDKEVPRSATNQSVNRWQEHESKSSYTLTRVVVNLFLGRRPPESLSQ